MVVWQKDELCGLLEKPQLRKLDYNVYVREDGEDKPLVLWGPAVADVNCFRTFESLDGLRKLHPEFSAHSQYLADYDGPLFKSCELGNFQLMKEFPGCEAATTLPSEIGKLLGREEEDGRFVGAYPPLP